jgi:CRISPR/Cas system-associated exonuclease Cas4 (RecB family)
LLFYVCAKKATNENIKVNAGIYRLRSNEEEVLCVSQQEVIDDSLIDLAEKEIKRIIEEILNKDLVFDQTKNHDNCKFCSYRKLCDRTI